MLRDQAERGFANFNPTTLSAGEIEAPFHPNRIVRIDHLVVTPQS